MSFTSSFSLLLQDWSLSNVIGKDHFKIPSQNIASHHPGTWLGILQGDSEYLQHTHGIKSWKTASSVEHKLDAELLPLPSDLGDFGGFGRWDTEVDNPVLWNFSMGINYKACSPKPSASNDSLRWYKNSTDCVYLGHQTCSLWEFCKWQGIDTAWLQTRRWCSLWNHGQLALTFLLKGGWRSDCWYPSAASYFLYIKQKCALAVPFSFRPCFIPSHK